MSYNRPPRSKLSFGSTIFLSFGVNAAVQAAGWLAAYLFPPQADSARLFDAPASAWLPAVQAAGWLLLVQALVALLLALALRRRVAVAWGILVGLVAMLPLPILFVVLLVR